MNAKIDALSVVAVPKFRSGIEVLFPIGRAHGATLTIHLKDGSPLPVGSVVLIVGRDEIHTVGYDGQVYIDGLAPRNTLRASWPNNNNCEFDVRYGASSDPLPDLGVFTCLKENHEGPE